MVLYFMTVETHHLGGGKKAGSYKGQIFFEKKIRPWLQDGLLP